jgi:hypothetical protein
MKLSQTALVFIVAIPLPLAAQSERPITHQQTSAVVGGRYEIVQSSLAAKWTFRLDRYAGRVSQLVATADSGTAWEDMLVFQRPTITTPTKARFQIFTSGMAARHTFLIDVDTGKSWVLVGGKDKDKDGKEFEYSAWQPFDR